MGYFANGTEGEMFEEEYCARCVHQNSAEGCPVMEAHFLYSYELCNLTNHPGKVILDMLIPRRGAFNQQCAMFYPRTNEDVDEDACEAAAAP